MKVAGGFAVLLCVLAASAQTGEADDPAVAAKEQAELQQAVSDAGNSSIDRIRALENHLSRYPESNRRAEIEKAIAFGAIDNSDNPRIILYGEKVLARETPPDSGDIPILLDRVIRALIDKEDPERAKRAVVYAQRYEADIAETRARSANSRPGHLTPAQWSEELDKANSRALALEARATGFAGDPAAAAKIARRSWDAHPTGEGARETAWWLAKTGNTAQAIEFYANAFTVEDARNTEQDRARDREELRTLYTKLHGSEKGLGDLMLEAWDRNRALMAALREGIKAKDPNSVATSLTDFTLPPVEKTTTPLVLSALKGKTVVLDFWATWCAPCRAQHPIIERVKARYAGDSSILFVPVNSDDDTSLVAGFIQEQGWPTSGYFEAGLARQLDISSIPTVLILNAKGEIASRMVGFIPERFEQMLTERVEQARK